MKIKPLSFLLFTAVLFLTGCGQAAITAAPTVVPTETAIVIPPTQTPAPTATITPTPTPDFSVIGLPMEKPGTTAFDFVDEMCQAQWFTEVGDLACPGDDTQADSGYVEQLDGMVQDLPSNIKLLLTFPPRMRVEAISSKYPEFQVQNGDRFRAVLACRAHTFCDVDFMLSYFDKRGLTGLTHWRYLFTDTPIVVDYPLDGISGKSVQFDLSVRADGNRLDAHAVWIAPHIYRPSD
jgi:hypothetical protein